MTAEDIAREQAIGEVRGARNERAQIAANLRKLAEHYSQNRNLGPFCNYLADCFESRSRPEELARYERREHERKEGERG